MSGFPYFKFFPADWLGSTSVACMTLEQQGAYVRLMAHAWQAPDGGLPDDDAALAMLSGLGDRWKTAGPPVKHMFRWRSGDSPDAVPEDLTELRPDAEAGDLPVPNGRCYNGKLVRLKRDSQRKSLHNADAANKRWAS